MRITATTSEMAWLNQERLNSLDAALHTERLATALRVNRGADDPSGLAIARGMEAMTRGQTVAVQNTQDGISLLQVQQAGYMEIHELLLRMRDLALRGANEAVLTARDREKLSDEMSQLAEQISVIAETTDFNGQKPLLGTPQTTNADLEVELEWTSSADLDLHVFEPGALPIGAGTGPGNHIYYNNTNFGSPGGRLDKDDNNGIINGYYEGVSSFNRVPVNVPTNPAQEHYIADPGNGYSGIYTIAIDRWVGLEPVAQNVDTNYTLRVFRWRGTTYESVTTFTGFIPADNTPPPAALQGYYDPFLGFRTEMVYTAIDSQDWNDAAFSPDVPGQDDPFSDFDASHTIEWSPVDIATPAYLQIGGRHDANVYHRMIEYNDCRAERLGVGGLDVSSTARAQNAVTALDTAIGKVSDYLNTSGAAALNLDHVINDLKSEIINVTAAKSRIEDADMAVEIAALTKSQLLSSQAAKIADKIYSEAYISRSLIQSALSESSDQNPSSA